MDRRTALQRIAMLAGGTLAGRIAQATLAGQIAPAPHAPSGLAPAERALLAPLTELIIPRTDTPGAIDAGVPAFVDHIVTSWYTPTEREIFRDGLRDLDSHCKANHGHSFVAASPAEQTAALSAAEHAMQDYAARPGDGILSVSDEHSPFFFKIKQLTVLGYYTSEVGATQELSYNPVPGSFDGDYDFAKVGRQWSS